jgi:hypothetical protein
MSFQKVWAVNRPRSGSSRQPPLASMASSSRHQSVTVEERHHRDRGVRRGQSVAGADATDGSRFNPRLIFGSVKGFNDDSP